MDATIWAGKEMSDDGVSRTNSQLNRHPQFHVHEVINLSTVHISLISTLQQ
jgi:hypothetical protein